MPRKIEPDQMATVAAILADMQNTLKALTGKVDGISSEQLSLMEKVAHNEVVLNGIIGKNMEMTDEEREAKEKAIAKRLDRNGAALRRSKRALLPKGKVKVVWRGGVVGFQGVTCGPYKPGTEVEVPEWVPGVWAEQDMHIKEAEEFQKANLAEKGPGRYLGEYT